jgi:2-methylcitrate dehydratase PrpD
MGNAARNGLLAALLAREGYDAAPAALEGRLGWARATGDVPDGGAMLGDLGRRWEFATNTYKPYPSGIVFHAVIEACLRLRERLLPDPGAIEAVTVRGSQLLLDRGDRPTLSARDARVSIAHNAAAALVRGSAGVADFAQGAVADPAVARVRAVVKPELDASLPQGAASITLRLHDGRTAEIRVDEAAGGPNRPMTDAALEAKFCANDPSDAAERRMALVWALEEAPDVQALMAAMARVGAR